MSHFDLDFLEGLIEFLPDTPRPVKRGRGLVLLALAVAVVAFIVWSRVW